MLISFLIFFLSLFSFSQELDFKKTYKLPLERSQTISENLYKYGFNHSELYGKERVLDRVLEHNNLSRSQAKILDPGTIIEYPGDLFKTIYGSLSKAKKALAVSLNEKFQSGIDDEVLAKEIIAFTENNNVKIESLCSQKCENSDNKRTFKVNRGAKATSIHDPNYNFDDLTHSYYYPFLVGLAGSYISLDGEQIKGAGSGSSAKFLSNLGLALWVDGEYRLNEDWGLVARAELSRHTFSESISSKIEEDYSLNTLSFLAGSTYKLNRRILLAGLIGTKEQINYYGDDTVNSPIVFNKDNAMIFNFEGQYYIGKIDTGAYFGSKARVIHFSSRLGGWYSFSGDFLKGAYGLYAAALVNFTDRWSIEAKFDLSKFDREFLEYTHKGIMIGAKYGFGL